MVLLSINIVFNSHELDLTKYLLKTRQNQFVMTIHFNIEIYVFVQYFK